LHEKYILNTVENSLKILKLFKNNKKLSFSQIQDELNMNKTTLYRLLCTLEADNFLHRNKQKFYELGIEFFLIRKNFFKLDKIKNISKPIMKKLVKNTELTAHLAYLEGNNIFYLDKVSAGKIELNTEVGTKIPPHCTAAGKAILAYKSKEKINDVIKNNNLHEYTQNTITDYKELIAHLESTKKRGYSTDFSEHNRHFSCIAVPIFDPKKEVKNSISLSGLSVEFKNKDKNSLVNLLKEAANQISNEFYKNSTY